ncbi:hypothetical protein ACH5RR_000143 [Cinchona calisaya]|uniref:Uncharacterized protein n=1 Tax=Cinchona calisaya TaxID=153742 RepID=A0ABD3AZT5_9GENT
MSLEIEDCSPQDKAKETCSKTDSGSRISYTREFLLSLSELEICKKLPSGFYPSILSEFDDASHSSQDRLLTHSSLPVQGFRRTEYGSSPPTRGDFGNFTRGTYGRWESRSYRSERDSDSQSDRESDSGRRFVNQSRKSSQGTEHDGLLGSGSFPRPSGHAAGISAPKIRGNDQYQVNRSNEPYHPPRPYKAVPLARRDTDSYNDETFGSSECTSEHIVEEERRRRASFELMRKEQQKALQEKQKSSLEKRKAVSVSDISVLLDDTKEEKEVLDRDNELDSATNPSISSIDCGKSTLPSQAPYRPLVPPGFKNTVAEKTSGLKLPIHSHSVENGSSSILETESSGEINVSGDPPEDKRMHISFLNKGEQISNSSLDSDVSSKKIGTGDFLHQNSIFREAGETLNEPEMMKLDAKVSGVELGGGELNQNDASSILGSIFGNTSTLNDCNSMDSVEHHDNKPDDSWSQKTVHSSKFAGWFVEEERKTEDDLSSSRPNDLLSLIVGSDKGRNEVDMKLFQHLPADFSDQRTEIANNYTATVSSATNGVSESLSNWNKQEPTILTCEDLEQTILSECGEKILNSEPPLEGCSLSGAKSEQPRACVDNHASQHLLSLLQKGASLNSTSPKTPVDIDSLEILPASDVYDVGASPYKTGEEVGKNIHASGETLTLETLFGTAFMKELQSVEAPVSVQRGSVGSGQAVADNDLFRSTVTQIELEKMTNEKKFLVSNHTQQVKMDKTEKWLGYDNHQNDLNLSNHRSEVVSKHDVFDGSSEYHLPEEESLIAVNDNLNAQISRLMPGRNSSKMEFSTVNATGDITEKLAAIGAAIEDDRSTTGSDGAPFSHGPYNQMEREIAHGNLHAQTSCSHFHSVQMSHGRPLLQPLDAHPPHMNSQMKFIGRESMIQHDAPTNQQFPTNMLQPPFHQPSVGVNGFDHPARHSMLQQMQMQMPGSFPPHLVNDLPRGAPVPYLGNQAPSSMQDLNPMPGYPFGPHQPIIGGHGMPLRAPDFNGGSNHPEAFQRLVEMELRAKSTQIPPFAFGHNQAMYGHDLDMGFRYR